jgi:hypothetical protein
MDKIDAEMAKKSSNPYLVQLLAYGVAAAFYCPRR